MFAGFQSGRTTTRSRSRWTTWLARCASHDRPALRAEADEYVASLVDEVDEHGKRLVVRNGRALERRVKVGSGTVAIPAPRVDDKRIGDETGERQRFSSKDALPKRLQPDAKKPLHETVEAPSRAETRAALERFARPVDAQVPKATAKLDRALRLPRRALAPPAHVERDRVRLRDRQAAHPRH